MEPLKASSGPIGALTDDLFEQMYRLMEAHYAAVRRERFRADLVEKDRVILLQDRQGKVRGFSTLQCYPFTLPVTHESVQIIYSGDTVIDRRHWGSQTLAFAWIRLAGREKARFPEAPLYWFLISKGPRTYRYLSTFSRCYWPHHSQPTPEDMRGLMDELATKRFGVNYDSHRGVVRFPESHGHLRADLAEVEEADRRRPEVAFFLRANPGYVRGDELVCLTELRADNLKSLAKRVFEKGYGDFGRVAEGEPGGWQELAYP